MVEKSYFEIYTTEDLFLRVGVVFIEGVFVQEFNNVLRAIVFLSPAF